ncbi:MAG: hypothetical protein EOO73_03240 [Myxococcales bacterium]|nr:MAG: hypothetical protein EOO73_03240 [Myxococcales bacterium]
MSDACPRSFEVEALRDGRLSGAERARFESHLASCAACKQEAAALDGLAEALRVSEEERSDELRVRRERTRLLAAFDVQLAPPPVRRVGAWWGAAALLAVVGGLALFLLTRPSARRAPASLPVPVVTVRADSSAQWSRRAEAERDVVTLARGALYIRVEPGRGRRLLVQLPDGELEDIGTVFSVSADAGRTTRVTVQEGSVVLRLEGKAPIALGAGEAWTPAPPPPASSEVAPLTAPAAPSTSSRVRVRPSDEGAKRVESPKAADSAEVTPDSAAEFRAAMGAFNQGEGSRAAKLFAAFLRRYPQDSRAEDAAYLRVLAHQRSGDVGATGSAARDYLARYPRGFRRAEVEALLGAPP